MKRIVPLFFLFIFTVASVKQYYPYLDYSLNKNYISAFLCINKDEPESTCEGKCYLKSQIKKLNPENNNDFPSPSPNEEVTSLLFFQIENEITFSDLSEIESKNSIYTSCVFSHLYQDIPTPPPKFLFS